MEAPENVKQLFDHAVKELYEEILSNGMDINRSSILLNTIIEAYGIIKYYNECSSSTYTASTPPIDYYDDTDKDT